MTKRHADDITVADYVRLRKENSEMNDILKDVAKWCEELGMYAEQGTVLVPVLKRACDWAKEHE